MTRTGQGSCGSHFAHRLSLRISWGLLITYTEFLFCWECDCGPARQPAFAASEPLRVLDEPDLVPASEKPPWQILGNAGMTRNGPVHDRGIVTV